MITLWMRFDNYCAALSASQYVPAKRAQPGGSGRLPQGSSGTLLAALACTDQVCS